MTFSFKESFPLGSAELHAGLESVRRVLNRAKFVTEHHHANETTLRSYLVRHKRPLFCPRLCSEFMAPDGTTYGTCVAIAVYELESKPSNERLRTFESSAVLHFHFSPHPSEVVGERREGYLVVPATFRADGTLLAPHKDVIVAELQRVRSCWPVAKKRP
jgi:hypothetical protein